MISKVNSFRLFRLLGKYHPFVKQTLAYWIKFSLWVHIWESQKFRSIFFSYLEKFSQVTNLHVSILWFPFKVGCFFLHFIVWIHCFNFIYLLVLVFPLVSMNVKLWKSMLPQAFAIHSWSFSFSYLLKLIKILWTL